MFSSIDNRTFPEMGVSRSENVLLLEHAKRNVMEIIEGKKSLLIFIFTFHSFVTLPHHNATKDGPCDQEQTDIDAVWFRKTIDPGGGS